MQDGVGGSTHCDIEAHRIFEGAATGDFPRQSSDVILFVPAAGQIHNEATRPEEQLLSICVSR